MKLIKTFLPALLTSFLVFAPLHSVYSADAVAQKVLIKMDHGTDDLHSAFMALKIGKMLADKKQDVTLFLNLEAVRLVDENQPMDLAWGMSDMTVAKIFNAYVKAGGKVLVCPHCAKVAGVKKLRNGARIATESEVAQIFIDADKVITY
jgi:predicted peroxiredoxin